MEKSLLYIIAGTGLSFALNYFLFDSENLLLDLFYAFSFGLAWGMAYFLDNDKFSLPKKLIISFFGMFFLAIIGILFFDFEKAIPSVFKFSIVFVAYYLIASFRNSKSLKR